MNWPEVLEDDDGIRPAGPPDECFYCHQKVGQGHGLDCPCVEKTVLLRYTFEIPVRVPWFWESDDVENHRNWRSCADNTLFDLEEISEGDGCLCDHFHCEFLKILDATPTRAKKEEKAND